MSEKICRPEVFKPGLDPKNWLGEVYAYIFSDDWGQSKQTTIHSEEQPRRQTRKTHNETN